METQRFSIFPRELSSWGRSFYEFDENASVFNIYEQVINFDVLIEILVQNNLYSPQNGKNIFSNIISVNYIMVVSQLPSIPLYWDCDHFIGNVGIQNIFMRIRHQDLDVLQNLHFADNTKQGKRDKDCKIRPTSNHLNESF